MPVESLAAQRDEQIARASVRVSVLTPVNSDVGAVRRRREQDIAASEKRIMRSRSPSASRTAAASLNGCFTPAIS